MPSTHRLTRFQTSCLWRGYGSWWGPRTVKWRTITIKVLDIVATPFQNWYTYANTENNHSGQQFNVLQKKSNRLNVSSCRILAKLTKYWLKYPLAESTSANWLNIVRIWNFVTIQVNIRIKFTSNWPQSISNFLFFLCFWSRVNDYSWIQPIEWSSRKEMFSNDIAFIISFILFHLSVLAFDASQMERQTERETTKIYSNGCGRSLMCVYACADDTDSLSFHVFRCILMSQYLVKSIHECTVDFFYLITIHMRNVSDCTHITTHIQRTNQIYVFMYIPHCPLLHFSIGLKFIIFRALNWYDVFRVRWLRYATWMKYHWKYQHTPLTFSIHLFLMSSMCSIFYNFVYLVLCSFCNAFENANFTCHTHARKMACHRPKKAPATFMNSIHKRLAANIENENQLRFVTFSELPSRPLPYFPTILQLVDYLTPIEARQNHCIWLWIMRWKCISHTLFFVWSSSSDPFP